MNNDHLSTFLHFLGRLEKKRKSYFYFTYVSTLFSGLLSFSTTEIVETHFKAFKFPKSQWEIVGKEEVIVEDGKMECGIACAVDSACTGIYFDDDTGTL